MRECSLNNLASRSFKSATNPASLWRGQHAAVNLAATSGVLPAGLRQIRLRTLRKTTGTRDLLHMYILHRDMIATMRHASEQ